MSGCRARRGRLLCWFMLLILGMAVAACAQPATPAATPLPMPDALDIYIMLTAKYTSPAVIDTIYDMSADDAGRILRALQAIEAPTELQALHEQAVEAYKNICAGKLLLPRSENVLRSEACFMIDWGIALFRDCQERLAEMRH